MKVPARSAARSLEEAPEEYHKPISSPISLATPAVMEMRDPIGMLHVCRKGWRVWLRRVEMKIVIVKQKMKCSSLSNANQSSPVSID